MSGTVGAVHPCHASRARRGACCLQSRNNKIDASLAVGDVAVANPTRRIDYIFTNKQSKNSPFKVTDSAQLASWMLANDCSLCVHLVV